MNTEPVLDNIHTRMMDLTLGLLKINLGLTAEGRRPESEIEGCNAYSLALEARQIIDEFISWYETEDLPDVPELLKWARGSTMNIYAPLGSKIRFSHPEAGYTHDQEKAREYLIVGSIYIVEWIDIGHGSTRVGLVGFPKVQFNSVMFSDVKDGDV